MKLKIFLSAFAILAILYSSAQNVGIADDGASFTPESTSVLELKSTTRGVLVPRMLTAERTGIGTPANGLLVYDTETESFWYYDNAQWNEIVSSSSSGNKLEDADGDTKIQVEESNDEDYIRFDIAGTERMRVADSGAVVIGDATNRTVIETDGTIKYEGSATVFDDLTVPGYSTKPGASAPPSTIYNASYLYEFINAGGDYVYFTVQMPHGWKEGSNIFPHVHYVCASTSAAKEVQWVLTYTWANVNGTFGASTAITTSGTADGDGNITADKHEISKFDPAGIDATGKSLSSVLLCRLERLNSDSYNGNDIYLLQIDFHYEKDTDGSRSAYIK